MANNVTLDPGPSPSITYKTTEDAGVHTPHLNIDTIQQLEIAGIQDGRKTVATPGTAETLVAAPTTCKRIDIVAETDNTGVIVVGASTVVASQATRRGVPLSPGQPYSLEIDDAQRIYLDTTVAGDGVTFIIYS